MAEERIIISVEARTAQFQENLKLAGISLGQLNKELAKNFQVTDKTGKITNRLTFQNKELGRAFKGAAKGARSFKFEWLSIMFAGMALDRVFGGLVRSQLELFGISELMADAWTTVLLPVFQAMTPLLFNLIEGFMGISEPVQIAIGVLVLLGAALAIVMLIAGQFVLFAMGIMLLVPGITSLGGAIAAIAAVLGSIILIVAGAIMIWQGFKMVIENWGKSATNVILGIVKILLGLAVVIAGIALIIASPVLAFVALGVVIAAIIGVIVAVIVKNWDHIKAFFVATWNAIKAAFSATWNWIKDLFIGVWDAMGSALGSALDGIKTAMSSAWDFMKRVTKGIANVHIGMGNAIGAVWNGIVSGIEAAINAIVGGINKLINAANKIPFVNIPTIGNVSFGFAKVPKMPYLAEGGIITRPTMAMLGEAGPEAVIPLNKMQGVTIYQTNTFYISDKYEMEKLIRENNIELVREVQRQIAI